MPKSASRPGSGDEPISNYPPPARTRERRVQQLVTQAENLIEQRIRAGTASPTETVALVRLGTEMERANIERVKMHTSYLEAQREKARSETVREELFTNAMKAMTRYQGGDPHDTDI
jgi:hypothetical protein